MNLQVVPDLNDAVPQQRDIWGLWGVAAPSGHFVFKGLLDHLTLIFGVGFDINPYKFGRLPAGFAVFLLVLPTLSTKEKCNLQKEKCFYACSCMIYMYVLCLYRSIRAYSTYIVVVNHSTFRWQCLSRVSVRSSCPGIGKWTGTTRSVCLELKYQFGINDFYHQFLILESAWKRALTSDLSSSSEWSTW